MIEYRKIYLLKEEKKNHTNLVIELINLYNVYARQQSF